MSKPTGLFERNGHYYLRLIIPIHKPHLLDGSTRIVEVPNISDLPCVAELVSKTACPRLSKYHFLRRPSRAKLADQPAAA
jgi:hypothetical protein